MPDKLPAKALLLDMDGVLVDSTRAIEARWTRWANRRGLPPADVVRSAHGVPIRQVVSFYVPAAEIEAEWAWMDAVSREPADILALPGARAALTQTHLPIAVATSASARTARQRLEEAGLPVPAVLISSDDVALGKPDPSPYLAAAAALGVDVGTCVVIEDAPAGLQSARSAGATPLGVATSHRPEELRAAHAVLPDLSALTITADGVEWTTSL